MSLRLPGLDLFKTLDGLEGVCDTILGCLSENLVVMASKLTTTDLALTRIFYLFCLLGAFNVLVVLIFAGLLFYGIKTYRNEQELTKRQWIRNANYGGVNNSTELKEPALHQ